MTDERMDKLEAVVGSMVKIINDLDARVCLLMEVISGRKEPKTITDDAIISWMEREGVPWDAAKQALMKEAENERSE